MVVFQTPVVINFLFITIRSFFFVLRFVVEHRHVDLVVIVLVRHLLRLLLHIIDDLVLCLGAAGCNQIDQAFIIIDILFSRFIFSDSGRL